MGASESRPIYSTRAIHAPAIPLIAVDPQYLSDHPTTFYIPRGGKKEAQITDVASDRPHYRFRKAGSLFSWGRVLFDDKNVPILTIGRQGVFDIYYYANVAGTSRQIFKTSIDWWTSRQIAMTTVNVWTPGNTEGRPSCRITVEGNWTLRDAIIGLDLGPRTEIKTHSATTCLPIARIRPADPEKRRHKRGLFVDMAAGVDTALVITLCEIIEEEMIARERDRNNAAVSASLNASASASVIASASASAGC